MKEYKIIPLEKLKFSNVREIRDNIVEEIKRNIEENGYYEARVLAVIKNKNDYLVADGNHRLKAIQELELKEVPCLIYDDKDIYQLAIEGNETENTYAPMDLFDWLQIIRTLKDDGLTLKEIGKKINQSESWVMQYSSLLKNILTPILEICKEYQEGRVSNKITNVSFDFTEGWFRTSGLYDLTEEYQQDCLERFIKDKCNWNKTKLQQETARYKQWQEFIETCEDKLVDQDNLDSMILLIENNTFKNQQQLLQKIGDFNKESKNKLICGDALIELARLEDGSIDVIIMDPPYGIDYHTERSKFADHVTKTGFENDMLQDALKLLDKTCKILKQKTRPNSHVYIFCNWKVDCDFKKIISKYFEIKNVIVWDKKNHGAGSFKDMWASRHEFIIFATKGNRPLSKFKEDLISISKIYSGKLIHPTQKPVEVITELLEASTQPNDTVCDPFMGSGSTIKACVMQKNLNYIGIELDPERFEKARAFIGGNNDD